MSITALRPSLALVPALLLALAGCGGGGGGGGSDGLPISVSGRVTFDYVPSVNGVGLDYDATEARPARGVVVQIRDGDDILSSVNADANGEYVIEAPSNATVTLVVLAVLGDWEDPNTQVVDNASGAAVWAMYEDVETADADLAGADIHLASGWTGTSYGGDRQAAPAAILDTIYGAQQLVLAADAAASFPYLEVNWSPGNEDGTYYDPSASALFILGVEDVDTDEYDDHVIAHEWGHYFEDNFSRADSVGGSHGAGDILDETVAFGEGFGNAFSGMVTGSRMYVDSNGVRQAEVNVVMDLEADSIPDAKVSNDDAGLLADGAWSESSVQEILWDIYDGGLDDLDGDGLSLGFAPIYAVLTGPQRTTDAFTTAYSFLTYLKAEETASALAIDVIAEAENIVDYDGFEQADPERYTLVPVDGTEVTDDFAGDTLTTIDTHGSIGDRPGNKLYNWIYLRAEAEADGELRIRVEPVGTSDNVVIRLPGGTYADDGLNGDAESVDVDAEAGDVIVFAVGSYNWPSEFTVQVGAPAPAPGKVGPAVRGVAGDG